MDIINYDVHWWITSNNKEMKLNNKKHFSIIILSLFLILVIMLISLNKKNEYLPEKNVGTKALNLVGIDFFSEKKINLDNLNKNEKFIIINIWSSWCLPCRLEHQYIKKINTINDSILIGINYKDKKNSAQEFLEELGNPYDLILSDIDGTISIELGAYGVPETYIINNEDKKIVAKYIGPLDMKKFEKIKLIIK